ncbi:MAG: efflux transporter periplasmic adaptor subunit [Methylotenera sp.]|jgi:cobalt-zinc-cadmium efflux system membrane fusion protein|uniref:efflux RND transporter periplasmic adaptor subunit n=1 Tax=Methylotenera sp. TaxID=2051956 RepID=UPI000D4ED6AD|nr:efflux RND transporter periplasmic adaptor subunit [Methylotenera sp.]PPC80667.1 MAG: efflux transporter periplasmic adaptor subunit [Methylotenera sp.]PPC95554.1 MAG: efflux transporter periplasmic adaptor subunit [Methylotenera sp.]
MTIYSKIKSALSSKQSLLIIIVILIGIILGNLILQSNKPKSGEEEGAEQSTTHEELDGHQHEEQAKELPKGPHAGKIFTQSGYGLEVVISNQKATPEFRVYTYEDGKLLDPATSNVTFTVNRLGRSPEKLTFVKEADYLKSMEAVEEPHSFKVSIDSEHNGKHYQFAYAQIEGRVTMTDRQLTLNGVEILTAGPARIKTTLNLIGEIKLNADKSVRVVPRLNGIVESVSANAGDKVRKGQLLAIVSSQSIADQRSDLMAAQKRLDLAKVTYEREKKLWEEKISAEQDYQQARQALQEAEINQQRAKQKLQSIGANLGSGSNLTRYEIKAPIDGVITDKQISAGQVLNGDESIFVVADLSTLWAEMTIYAKDVGAVKIGQKVTVKASAFEAQTTGTVAYVGALVGEQSRTAIARVVLKNADKVWLPGIPVNIELQADEVEVPLAVSVEGLQSMDDGKVVFGRYADLFEVRPLTLGRGDDKYVEVLSGLSAGEKYAAQNSYLVKAELGKASATHDD